jgi:hypothetical protein
MHHGKVSEILVHTVLLEKYKGRRQLLTYKRRWEDDIKEDIT